MHNTDRFNHVSVRQSGSLHGDATVVAKECAAVEGNSCVCWWSGLLPDAAAIITALLGSGREELAR